MFKAPHKAASAQGLASTLEAERTRVVRKLRRQFLSRLWEGECAYCRAYLTSKDLLPFVKKYEPTARERTDDHVVPRSLGGRDRLNNLVPACIECNSRRLPDEFAREYLVRLGYSPEQIVAWLLRVQIHPGIAESMHDFLDAATLSPAALFYADLLGDFALYFYKVGMGEILKPSKHPKRFTHN